MNWFLRTIVVSSFVLAALGQTTAESADSFPPPVPPAPSAAGHSDVIGNRLVGVAGCTAVSCHGGRSLLGGEASAWLSRDVKHRQAYDVLFNDVSVAMAAKLGLKAAHTEARCLACHSAARQPEAAHGERFAIEFGVACESCHGAGGDWLKKHTTQSWKSLSADQKAEFGFRDLRSLTVRTETCVACHVGSPAATVDHDLIAAGHPRLAFEMSAYHSLMPKHWASASVDVQRDPAQEVRLWAIGQAVSAKVMADVAADRAKQATQNRATHVLPDLAEFDCSACHHDLTEPTRGRPTLRSPLGTPRWGSWSMHSARFLATESKQVFGADGDAAGKSLAQLIEFMDASRLRSVPADDLAQRAKKSSDDLGALARALQSSSADSTRLTQLLNRLTAADAEKNWLPTWDGQTQRYLALAAVNQSLQSLHSKESLPATALGRLPQGLRNEPGYATPQKGYSPELVNTLFRDLHKPR